MAYAYDVFLSYSRRDPVLTWVADHFKPLLEQWLAQSMAEEPTVFRDEESIETGASWPLVLQQGLLRSKVVVAILAPSYFRSPWCRAEWASIRRRETLLGLRTEQSPQSHLIYPVWFHDGEHFPEEVQGLMRRDLRPWNRASPAFRQTLDYHSFLGEMQTVAAEVAHMVAAAPPWQPDFPLIELPGLPGVTATLPRL